MSRIMVVTTTDSMIYNFLTPHIKELEKNGHYVECACSVTGAFFQDLENIYQLKMNKVNFKRSPYSLKNIGAYKMLCKLIKEKNIDTIFCHEPVGGAIGRLAGHKLKCKVIYMAHGFHFYKGAPKSRKLYYIVEKFLSRYTDILVTINKEDYEASQKFKAKKCVKINGIGVDTTRYDYKPTPQYIRDELKLPNNSIIYLSVGELIPRKNHETIIRAIAKSNNPQNIYVIAGDGKLRLHLEKLITKLKIEKNVFLLGYRKDINMLCNSADVFVMPSIHEGLSVALMEAMACGKAVIASKIRGNTDLIDENNGGFLINTFDINSYAIAIEKIKDKIIEFGKYNRNAIKSFDLINVVPNIQELFN